MDAPEWMIMGFGSSQTVLQLIPAGVETVNSPKTKTARINVFMLVLIMANVTPSHCRGQRGGFLATPLFLPPPRLRAVLPEQVAYELQAGVLAKHGRGEGVCVSLQSSVRRHRKI